MPLDLHPIDDGPGRLANGVRRRFDGGGDGFAEAHRRLGRGSQMHDIDALFGLEVFGANTGDRLFVEYEPDAYANRLAMIRRFAVVAMFDRKASVLAARDARNALSTALYLHLCRTLGERQPRMPRFFWCCGPRCGPWRLLEVDPSTGEELPCHAPELAGENIGAVWRAIGLAALRAELRRWITGAEAAA